MDRAVVEAVIADWKTAPIDERLRACFRFLETQTLHPYEINREFINKLNGFGLGDRAIEDVAMTGFHFNFINRVADAYDFPLPTPKQKHRQAKMLNLMGRFAPTGKRANPSWVIGADQLFRPQEVDLGREHLFQIDGVIEIAVRRAVEGLAAKQWRGVRADPESVLPDELSEYVKLLSLHAYQVTDEHVKNLKSVGWTDRQLFEITFAAALGASLPALENLFAVIGGASGLSRGIDSKDAP